ncbi:hypothetical protein [Streptomyces sp. NBC_00847]|uniref:hypothetical protein n=1 Tax=unclassified Streptomyces TaxID=2593676 RepID=UPI002B1D8DB7|nr:hypothetical protein [Streptomyces sp. NBC_00847]
MEPSLFAHRGFPAALVTSTSFFAATNGLMTVIVPQLQPGLDADVLTAGLAPAPWSVGLAVASWTAGAYLVGRYGARLMSVGLALLLGALSAIAVYGTAGADSVPTLLLPALAVVGLGVGLFIPPSSPSR